MQSFNEANPCKKCGATDAKTEYQDHSPATGTPMLPLMRRDCRRCSYIWFELPLDAPDLEAYFDKKGRHIESLDANAICLCGEKVVAYKDGLYVCPNAVKKVGAA